MSSLEADSTAPSLAKRYIHLHNHGVSTNNFSDFFDLFAASAEMIFEGSSFGPLIGKDAIKSGFKQNPPDKQIIAHDISNDFQRISVITFSYENEDKQHSFCLESNSEGLISKITVEA
jgi:hypothetical protein